MEAIGQLAAATMSLTPRLRDRGRWSACGRCERPGYHDHCAGTARESSVDEDMPELVKDLQDEWYVAQGSRVPDRRKALGAAQPGIRHHRRAGAAMWSVTEIR